MVSFAGFCEIRLVRIVGDGLKVVSSVRFVFERLVRFGVGQDSRRPQHYRSSTKVHLDVLRQVP